MDDRGKDAQNRITTVAGFAATDIQWANFEAEVEPVFSEYGVKVLHARDLENPDNEFEGWSATVPVVWTASGEG